MKYPIVCRQHHSAFIIVSLKKQIYPDFIKMKNAKNENIEKKIIQTWKNGNIENNSI